MTRYAYSSYRQTAQHPCGANHINTLLRRGLNASKAQWKRQNSSKHDWKGVSMQTTVTFKLPP